MRNSNLAGIFALTVLLLGTGGCESWLCSGYTSQVVDLQGQRRSLQEKLDAANAERLRLAGALAALEAKYASLLKEKEQLVADANAQRRALEAKNDDLNDQLQDALKKAGLNADVIGGRVRVSIESDFLFDLGKYDVKADSVGPIKRVIETINEPRWEEMTAAVDVVGHTDNLPIHAPAKYLATTPDNANYVLGFLRAFYVAQEMVKAGYSWGKLEIASCAFYQPLVPHDTASNRAKNRRVEIYIRLKSKKEAGTVATPVVPAAASADEKVAPVAPAAPAAAPVTEEPGTL